MADVGIIGGGIIGCAVADELSRRGARVVVFESRDVGAGATQASAGALAPYIEGHDEGPLRELTLQSLGMYDAFIERVSADAGRDVEYRRCGTLELAADAESVQILRARADGPLAAGAQYRWMSAADLRRTVPAVAESVQGALYCGAHGYVVVADLVAALETAARARGVTFLTGTAVTRVAPRPGAGFTVTTAKGSHEVNALVMCAGSWTGGIDLGSELAGSVRPVRGQLLRLGWRGQPIAHILWGPDCYIVPWRDGTLLVGATVEDVGFDERATAAGVQGLLRAACDVLPGAEGATFLGVRVGLRPASGNGLPIVRPSAAVRGLFFATGHFRNGILLAPLTATIVADTLEIT